MDTNSQKNINDSFVGNETESFLNSRLDGASVQVVDDDTLHVEVTNPLCVTYTPQCEADVFDRRFQKAYSQIVAAMKAITPAAPDFLTIQSPHKQFNAFDPHNLLQPNDITLLEKVDQLDYPLLRYANLAALHREVIVVVSAEMPLMPDMVETMTYDELVETLDRLDAMINQLKMEQEERPTDDGGMKLAYLKQLYDIYKKAKDDADQEGKSGNDEVTVTFPSSGGKLGEYVRCNPGDIPIVYLYYNNISMCYPNNITNMLAYVYVHEMMHAYYDTDKSLSGSQHYIPCLEEPLAELGALRFMKAYDNTNTIYTENLRDVERKKYSASVCFYGFGAYLGGVLQDTTLPELMYRQSKPITGTAVSEYEKVWKAHIYPFNSEVSVAKKMFAIFITANMGQRYRILTPVGANHDESKLYEICDAIAQHSMDETQRINNTSLWAFILASLYDKHYFQGRANTPAFTMFINAANAIVSKYNFPKCPAKSTLSVMFAAHRNTATDVWIPDNIRDCIQETLN